MIVLVNELTAEDATDPKIEELAQDIVSSKNIDDCTSAQKATLTTQQQTLNDNVDSVNKQISEKQMAIADLTGSTVVPETDPPPTAAATTTGPTTTAATTLTGKQQA